MKNIFKWIAILLVTLTAILWIYLRFNYGGGVEYPNISTNPIYDQSQLELVISYEEPIGNVAASIDTNFAQRVFFTIHPESRPSNHKLVEIVNGKAIPYPNETAQSELFETVLGVFVDLQHRLWTIDHGNHGFGNVKLTAFDLRTNKVVHEYIFPDEVGEKLSFFNDLSVTPDGKYVFVADVSFFGQNPSLIVYNIEKGQSRRLLERHESVYHENYVPVTPNKKMRFFGGAVDLLTGIDGLDISRDGQYIYYAAMGHSGLYRIPVSICIDFSKTNEEVNQSIERVSDKPLSDGIRTDYEGNVYITDIENQGIFVVEPSGKKYTLIKDERIRWADGMALGADGYMYLADSDIPNQMMRTKSNMKRNAPYNIFKFKPLSEE